LHPSRLIRDAYNGCATSCGNLVEKRFIVDASSQQVARPPQLDLFSFAARPARQREQSSLGLRWKDFR